MQLKTKRTGNYTSLFLSCKVPFTRRTFRWHTILYNTPETWVHGYSSRTEDGRYVLFHDYDSLDLSALCSELRYLQKKFKLSNYYVFKLDRPDSWHAVCLDTFSLSEAYEIQKQTSCDFAFINSIKRLQTREWILRWYEKGEREKPLYHLCLDSAFHGHVKSLAHKDFLMLLGVPESKMPKGRYDGHKNLSLVDYDTSNRVKS